MGKSGEKCELISIIFENNLLDYITIAYHERDNRYIADLELVNYFINSLLHSYTLLRNFIGGGNYE